MLHGRKQTNTSTLKKRWTVQKKNFKIMHRKQPRPDITHKQGGISDELFNQSELQAYLLTGGCGGWFGALSRYKLIATPELDKDGDVIGNPFSDEFDIELDKKICEYLKTTKLSLKNQAGFFSSTVARHMDADILDIKGENNEIDPDSLKNILDYYVGTWISDINTYKY